MLGEQIGQSIQLQLQARDLLQEVGDPYHTVLGYHGLGAVYQVVEHFGLHYGQITYITKMLHGKDLGFYTELHGTGRAS